MRTADFYDPNAGSSKTGSSARLYAHSHSVVPLGLLATRVLNDLTSQSTGATCRPVLVRGKSLAATFVASAWLPEALDEFSELDAEALDSGYQPPSQPAKDHAEHILKSLGDHPLPVPSVYPTSDGEVAIFFRNEARVASVLILCASDGQGACFAFANGRGRRARYEDAGELPDAFIREQLLQLI